MGKTQCAGMQQQPLRAALPSVQRIAEDGVPDGREMHAQLVGAAGDGLQFHAGCIGKTVRPELVEG